MAPQFSGFNIKRLKIYRFRKFIQRFLAAMAAVFLFVVYFYLPAAAGISSVDSYFEQHPEEVAQFASELNLQPLTAAPIVPAEESVSVVAEVLDSSGNVIATTSNGVTRAVGSNPVVRIAGGGLAVGAVGAAAISSLQNKAASTQVYGDSTKTYSGTADTYSLYYPNQPTRVSFSQFYGPVTTFVEDPCTGVRSSTGQLAQWCTTASWNPPTKTVIVSISSPDPDKPWSQATQQQRDNAVAALSPSDYRQAISIMPVVRESILPSQGKKVRITPPSGVPIVVQKSDGSYQKINAPTDFDIADLSPSPTPSPSDSPTPSPSPSDSPTPSPSPSSSPTPSPSPSSSPSPSPGDNQPPSPPSSPPSTCATYPSPDPDPDEDDPASPGKKVPLDKIRWSQKTVSAKTSDGRTINEVADAMKNNGWDISRDPPDMVDWGDGEFQTLDHRRLIAAKRAGLNDVPANVHAVDEPLTTDEQLRFRFQKTFTDPVTGTTFQKGDVPKTWGEAAMGRAAKQGSNFPLRGSTQEPTVTGE